MAVLTGRPAPDFKTKAVVNGSEFKDIRLSDFKGRYVVLFFYPLDFTFVCPTEIVAFQEKYSQFKERNCEVLGCSIDSHYTHMAWLSTPANQGGIQGVKYPLLADVGGRIARDYDVLTDDHIAFRGLFLIDRDGVVRHQLVNDLPLGRNVDEAIRMVDALQHFEKNGEVCPAGWQKGKEAIKATKESVASYLAKK
jgi:peroxiredoxin (alkyl hydroperoxide reductase subunit C)